MLAANCRIPLLAFTGLTLSWACPASAQMFALPDTALHGGAPFLYSDQQVPCSSFESNARTLRVELPEGASVIQIYTQMANYPWVGGRVPCRASISPPATWSNCPQETGECSIGWSKVRNLLTEAKDGRQVVTADFHNWKDDNHRQARLLVYYRR